MAESGLSIAYADLLVEVGDFLGYGKVRDNFSEVQEKEIDRYVQAGIRQFYYPPAVEGVEAGYDWSFLNPTNTLATTADDAAQDLPDDCGRVIGDFFYAPDVYNRSIPLVSESRILALLQDSTDTGKPRYVAVRIKGDGVDDDEEREPAAVGQRLEAVWWPIPDDAYTLTYRYEAFSGKLTDALKTPLGGMVHSELITESCLSVAEIRANDERGIHWESFSRLLKAGVAKDRKQGARFFGQMGEPGDNVISRHCNQGSNYEITYHGDTW